MPRVSPLQSSFNAGETSPLIYARSDIDKYKNGLQICLNARVLVQGGWSRRSGEYYVAPTKANGVARLVRFEFSVTQAYMSEFGNLYVRFYKDDGAITETALVITGVTAANPPVVTYTGSDPTNGDDVEIAAVVGMTQLNGRRFTVANVNAGANTLELKDPDGTTNINATAYTAYASGGTMSRVYTVTTTYATADLFQLRFAQSTDTLYPAHSLYAPRKLTRTAHTSWTLSTIAFRDGPYQDVNTTATTLLLSGTTGSITVTASSPVFTVTTDIGRLIRWKDAAGNWTWLTISATASTTSVTATVSGPDASAVTATVNWRLGAWSITTGYPAAVAFFEDRLCYGGTTTEPHRVDMSNSGDYENFAPSSVTGTVSASNAVSATMNAGDVNGIRWLDGEDEKAFLVGTSGGVFILRASVLNEALSSTNRNAKKSVKRGSANIQPVRVGKAVLYMQRSGRKLRELAYVYEDDGFKAPNMSRLADHITYGGVKQLAYEEEPNSTVWAVRNDGTLLGFTYERDDAVFGWQRHIFGGYSDAAQQTQAVCESAETIPAPDGLRDETWVIVKRYINGATRRYVGYLKKHWERGDHHHDAFYVDAGLALNNTVAQTLTPGTGATLAHTTGVIFEAGGAVFSSGDVARYIHYDYLDEDGERQRASAIITGYTDTTHVTATINYPWPNLNLIASAGWRMTVTTVGGLWHLEGQGVSVFGDGATQPDKTVSLGSITLSYPASKVAVGLGYRSDGQTLRIDDGSEDGTAQGKVRRIHRVVFRFHDTLGIKIGPSFDKLVQQTFRTGADAGGVAPPLFSGDKRYPWEGDYDTEGYICWRQDQPEPATVLAVMPQLQVNN